MAACKLAALVGVLLAGLVMLFAAAGEIDGHHLNLPTTQQLIEDAKIAMVEIDNLVHADPAVKDTDSDGLNDAEEVALGTSIVHADTDSDGLTDFEEVTITKTDPLNPDSDGDGTLDGDHPQEREKVAKYHLEHMIIEAAKPGARRCKAAVGEVLLCSEDLSREDKSSVPRWADGSRDRFYTVC